MIAVESTERSLREERARNEYGTRAATSSQTADARTHGSRGVLAGGGNNRRDPDESGHRLSLEAKGSHSRRSRPARWQTWTPRQSASPVLHWLESRCQATSLVASSQLQKELQEQLGVRISISHLNAVRATHGWSTIASQAGKKSGGWGSERSGGSRRAVVVGSRPGDGFALPSGNGDRLV